MVTDAKVPGHALLINQVGSDTAFRPAVPRLPRPDLCLRFWILRNGLQRLHARDFPRLSHPALSFSVIVAKSRRINALSSAVTGCLPAAESRGSRPERDQGRDRSSPGLSGDALLGIPGPAVARSRFSSGRTEQASGRAQGTASSGISGTTFPIAISVPRDIGALSLLPFNQALRTQRHVGNQTGAAVTPSLSATGS